MAPTAHTMRPPEMMAPTQHNHKQPNTTPRRMPIFDAPVFSWTNEENANYFSFLRVWQSEGGRGVPSTFDSDSVSICIDTGASCCISNDSSQFIQMDPIENVKVTGIDSIRIIRKKDWHRPMDFYGRQWTGNVPDVPMCLRVLCPQQVAQQTKKAGDGFQALAQRGILIFNGYAMTVRTIDKAACRFYRLAQVRRVSSFSMPSSRAMANTRIIFRATSANYCSCITSYRISVLQRSSCSPAKDCFPKTLPSADIRYAQLANSGKHIITVHLRLCKALTQVI